MPHQIVRTFSNAGESAGAATSVLAALRRYDEFYATWPVAAGNQAEESSDPS
jgi:hypothetical protein